MAGLWRPLLQLGAAAAWLCALGALSAVPGPPESRAQGECGMPLQIENAEWSGSGTRLRYSCVKNYKRKAGKSSLVVCKQDSVTKEFRWEAQLSCIRDPSLPAPKSMTEGSRRGSPYFRIGLICLVAVVLIVLLVLILVCLYRRQHRVLQQADIPLAERIPMAVERAEGDQTTPTATNPDDPGPTTEGTQMLPSPCATSTS
ncbi:uncharacterized protein LOC133390128 isoform X1 [Rhineura floridana]|uniref:uncharacterized protein LOC133390128 isoform X1 n=1 Tax=Rhineura floridana TaxID=261503 RepID=UPI002AC80CF8|nr:uncharacterized protein LOC133390128 isoform X1 [Rhineura floridana]